MPTIRKPIKSIPVAKCDSSESWSGGSVSFNSVWKKEGFTNSLSLSSTGSLNITSLIFTNTQDFSEGKYIQFDAKALQPENLDGYQLFFLKDTGQSNYASVTITNMAHGWERRTFHHDQFTANGTWTDDDWAAVKQVIIGVDAQASTTATVLFQNIRSVRWAAEIYFEVDDGLITIGDRFQSVCEQYDIKYSFFIYSQYPGVDANYHTWPQIKQIQDDGNSVGFHNHAIGNVTTANSTRQEIHEDWIAGIQTMQSNNIALGRGNRYHYAASNGALTPFAIYMQRDYFASGRQTSYPASFGNHYLPMNNYEQWGWIYRPSVTGADVGLDASLDNTQSYLKLIDNVVEEQKGATFVFHYMTPDVGNDLASSEFTVDEMCKRAKQYKDQGLALILTRDDLNFPVVY